MFTAGAVLIRWALPFAVKYLLSCTVATGNNHFKSKGLISDQGKHEKALYALQKAYKDKTISSATGKSLEELWMTRLMPPFDLRRIAFVLYLLAVPYAHAQQLLAGNDVTFKGCYAHRNGNQLILGNSHLRRTWPIEDGHMFATSIFDRDTNTEWAGLPSALPSPMPSVHVASGQLTLREAGGTFGLTEAPSLRIELGRGQRRLPAHLPGAQSGIDMGGSVIAISSRRAPDPTTRWRWCCDGSKGWLSCHRQSPSRLRLRQARGHAVMIKGVTSSTGTDHSTTGLWTQATIDSETYRLVTLHIGSFDQHIC